MYRGNSFEIFNKVIKMSKEYTLENLLDFGEDGKKLIPVAIQDRKTKNVLFIGFSDRKSYEMTERKRFVVLFSRSQNKYWMKGETSRDLLKVIEKRVNCKQNYLLYIVEMLGKGACHAKDKEGNAYKTCYYRRIKDGKLENI